MTRGVVTEYDGGKITRWDEAIIEGRDSGGAWWSVLRNTSNGRSYAWTVGTAILPLDLIARWAEGGTP